MTVDPETATRKIVEIFATGDLGAVPSLIAPAYVDHQGLGDIEIRGPDGFRQVVAAARAYGHLHVTIEDLVTSDDRAAVRLRWDATKASGGAVTWETLDLLRFDEDRLVEHWGAPLWRRET